jgi:hypothetical protein
MQAQRIMAGAPPMSAPELPTMPLPNEVDEPPTIEEVKEYARWVFMDWAHESSTG